MNLLQYAPQSCGEKLSWTEVQKIQIQEYRGFGLESAGLMTYAASAGCCNAQAEEFDSIFGNAL